MGRSQYGCQRANTRLQAFVRRQCEPNESRTRDGNKSADHYHDCDDYDYNDNVYSDYDNQYICSAITTTMITTTACQGDSSTRDAGHVGCTTYSSGGKSADYCFDSFNVQRIISQPRYMSEANEIWLRFQVGPS